MSKNNSDRKKTDMKSPLLVEENSTLLDEYTAEQALYANQPPLIQRYLDAQAQKMIDVLRKNQMQAAFTLPDKVVLEDQGNHMVTLPVEQREQEIGSVMNRLIRTDLRFILRQRLAELVGSSEQSVSVAARLFRHAIAMTMVHTTLPSGKNVKYFAPVGEEIPSIPLESDSDLESAITQSSDAIVEEGLGKENRGVFQVPFVPAARKFYLPQWVAIDDSGKLLVNSINDAEAHLSSMQAFLTVLHNAVSLAPYIMVDPIYQQKRYGMLGQLVNQGRALALYEIHEIVRIIKSRADRSDLNRGLTLSVPYFDDQLLEIRTHDFEVIPAGRIMFVPAFVVRAAREEQAKIAQDTRLSSSTRKYLLAEILILERAFDNINK
jgi:hypothetical protein